MENHIINMFSDCLTSVKHDDHVCVNTWTPTTAFPEVPRVRPEWTTQPNMVFAKKQKSVIESQRFQQKH